MDLMGRERDAALLLLYNSSSHRPHTKIAVAAKEIYYNLSENMAKLSVSAITLKSKSMQLYGKTTDKQHLHWNLALGFD